MCNFQLHAGGLAIAVPGELRGFELAHSRYGRLEWKELFEPAAKLADEGFTITSILEKAITMRRSAIVNNGIGMR